MAAVDDFTETTVVSLVFHFRGHQQSEIEVVDALEVLEELDDLVVSDDTQIFHSDSKNGRFSEVDVEYYKEYAHRHNCGKA